jgi:hypothetical protein
MAKPTFLDLAKEFRESSMFRGRVYLNRFYENIHPNAV